MSPLMAMNEIGPVLLGLCVILVVAKLGGEAASRLRQPTVVGEILAGVVVGNLGLLGLGHVDVLRADVFDVLAEIGILLLLFEIGVETTVPQMLKTGWTAVLVAVVGVVVPVALGAGVSWLFFPTASGHTHLFVGAILCATSVGITARVLQELGCIRSPEARLILGAAVIDDILGLVLLATVSGLVLAADRGATLGAFEVSWTALKALLFLAVSIPLGLWFAPRLFQWAARFRTQGLLLASGLAFCFLFAYLCTLVGLAPIVGAFAAGLIIEDRHLEVLSTREMKTLVQQIEGLTSFLLPVFFVLIGTRVDVRAFADGSVLAFAAALCVAATIGKLACAAVVRPHVDRWTVGLGMLPRGEVGFIFASIGTTLHLHGRPIVTPSIFAAAVLVVIATTLAAPPLLGARLKRAACALPGGRPRRSAPGPAASAG
jgi:Kef-type K+ transport system membrane component KefB